MMQLIGLQTDIAWEAREANHARVREMLEKSPPTPGALVALPEMFASGFSMNLDRITDDESRASELFLCETAKRLGIFLVGGLVTRGSDGRGRNEAIVAGPTGDVLARYCKIHPYTPGKEARHFCGGDAVVTFKCGDFTVSPFVCYDLRFPEAFRAAMQRGANVLVVIANWPSPRVEHWVTLLRARAIENQSYVMGVNRCGTDPFLPYSGRSLIIDPRGAILADAGDAQGAIAAEIDLATVTNYRRELPFLADTKRDLAALFR